MAFCINCGQELSEEAKFCSKCGKEVNVTPSNSDRKNVYEGSIHKCPNCGEVLNSFVTNCPSCGYEIRNTQGVSSVQQLAMKLEQLEANRPPKKKTNIYAQAFGFGTQIQSVDEQKIELIRNFLIPNTKEDVLEFILLASANIDLKLYGFNGNIYNLQDPARREVSDAWIAKLEQADKKAEILLGNTQEYQSVRNIYKKKLKAVKWRQHQILWIFFGWIGFLMLILLLLFLL